MTRSKVRSIVVAFLLVTSMLLWSGPGTVRADSGDGEAKKSIKKLGKNLKKLGEKVGEASKEAGQDIADAAKKVFYKGKKVSAPLLKKTQSATKEFWNDLIKQRKKAARELEKENRKLRKELEEDR